MAIRRNNNNKNKRNPLMRKTQRIPRPRIQFDGTTIRTSFTANDLTTAANIVGTFQYIGAGFAGSACGTAANGIAQLYSQYKFTQMSMQWLPGVAPGVAAGGGRVYISYLDNPEKISNFLALTEANKILAIKSMRNMVSWNVWENKTFNIPLTFRRKSFSVDGTQAVGVDNYERTLQGLVCIGAESVGAADTIGKFVIRTTLVLEGFSNIAS